MKKTLKSCLCILLGLAFCFGVGLWIKSKQPKEIHIPDIFELQQMLLDKGFDLGPKSVDGRLGGSDSYTQKAWNRNSCDQMYEKTMARMNGEKNEIRP